VACDYFTHKITANETFDLVVNDPANTTLITHPFVQFLQSVILRPSELSFCHSVTSMKDFWCELVKYFSKFEPTTSLPETPDNSHRTLFSIWSNLMQTSPSGIACILEKCTTPGQAFLVAALLNEMFSTESNTVRLHIHNCSSNLISPPFFFSHSAEPQR